MENPWKKLPSKPPYILNSDLPLIEKHNINATNETKIITEMYPEPFLGNIDSNIVLLNLNPGFGGEEDLDNHLNNNILSTLLLNNLNQDQIGYPFVFLHPDLEDIPGYRWWNDRLRTLVEVVGKKRLSESILCLEFFPYHSKSYKFGHILSSQQYNFYLLKLALKRNAIIICMRSFNKWLNQVPELENYKRIFRLNSNQSVYITRKNCPIGYIEILKHFNINAKK